MLKNLYVWRYKSNQQPWDNCVLVNINDRSDQATRRKSNWFNWFRPSLILVWNMGKRCSLLSLPVEVVTLFKRGGAHWWVGGEVCPFQRETVEVWSQRLNLGVGFCIKANHWVLSCPFWYMYKLILPGKDTSNSCIRTWKRTWSLGIHLSVCSSRMWPLPRHTLPTL